MLRSRGVVHGDGEWHNMLWDGLESLKDIWFARTTPSTTRSIISTNWVISQLVPAWEVVIQHVEKIIHYINASSQHYELFFRVQDINSSIHNSIYNSHDPLTLLLDCKT